MMTGLMAQGSGAATDPLFADVVALLHFDGTNGSTTFTDVIGNTWSATGNAQLSTALSKFGTASLILDGNNDLISATSTDFVLGSGDFTIEGYIYRTGNSVVSSVVSSIFVDMRTAEPSVEVEIDYNGSADSPSLGISFFMNGADRIASGANAVASAFRHVALCRASGTTRLFVEGTQVGSDYADANNYTSDTIYLGGRFAAISGDRRSMNGNIDEVRVTRAARYTSNFTPPTSPFPDS